MRAGQLVCVSGLFFGVGFSWVAMAEDSPNLIPKSVDLLHEEVLKKNKSKTVRVLKKAYTAIENKNIPQARRFAFSAQKDKEYSDYAHWIQAAAQFGEGLKAFGRKNYPSAIQFGQKSIRLNLKIEENYPYSPLMKIAPREIAQAETLVGASYCKQGKWGLCEEFLERAFQRLSLVSELGTIRPETLDLYSEACSKSETKLCIAWLQRFGTFFPKDSVELQAIVRFFPEAADKARPSFSGGRSTQTYKAPDFDQVEFDAAIGLYMDRKFKQSISEFRHLLDEYPKSSHRFRARYWLAQAMQHEGNEEEAKTQFESLHRDSPLTYYGLLASIADGKSIDSVISATVPDGIAEQEFMAPLEVKRLSRARSFLAEDLPEFAALELKEIRARDGLSNFFLLYLAALHHQAKSYSISFTLLNELIQRGYEGVFSSWGLRMIFPVEHLDMIKQYSLENKLDPILVLSLIKQESAFDSIAVSSAGALGLMQLMPATASDVFSEIPRADLTGIEPNIRTGTRYLSKLLTRFNGNIVYALAGYNAGPAAVDRWVRANPSRKGLVEFVEAIPFKETREYVSSIIRNYFWYSLRLNNETPKSLDYFWNVYGPPEPPLPPKGGEEQASRKKKKRT